MTPPAGRMWCVLVLHNPSSAVTYQHQWYVLLTRRAFVRPCRNDLLLTVAQYEITANENKTFCDFSALPRIEGVNVAVD